MLLNLQTRRPLQKLFPPRPRRLAKASSHGAAQRPARGHRCTGRGSWHDKAWRRQGRNPPTTRSADASSGSSMTQSISSARGRQVADQPLCRRRATRWLDLGANTGYFALVVLRKGACHVTCVEAEES